jgi:hypothetical protein
MQIADLSQALVTQAEASPSAPETRALQQTLFAQADTLSPNELDAALVPILAAIADPQRSLAGTNVLAIVAGAMAESGAKPPPLMRALLPRLATYLKAYARFQGQCDAAVQAQGLEAEGDVPKSIQNAVAQADPAGGAAWMGRDCWTQPTLACLCRSAEARAMVRAEAGLLELAYETIGYDTLLGEALAILDDEPLLVLHPSTHQGFEVRCSAVTNNSDLEIVLAALLFRTWRSGPRDGIRTRRPSKAVISALDRGGHDTPLYQSEWNKYDWRAAGLAGIDASPQSDFWIWNEGRPADIPKIDGRRIIIFGPCSYPRSWSVHRMFGPLRPFAQLERALPRSQVDAWIRRLAALRQSGQGSPPAE